MFNRNLTVSQSNNSVTYSLSLTCINSFNNCSIIKVLFGSNLWFFARKYLKYIFKPKNKISRLRGLNPFGFKGYHVILSWSNLNFWRAQNSMILLWSPAKIIYHAMATWNFSSWPHFYYWTTSYWTGCILKGVLLSFVDIG